MSLGDEGSTETPESEGTGSTGVGAERVAIDRGRLVEWASRAIEVPSFTGDEEAMEQGGRLAAKAKVTDELLDKCKPIAGTPSDCIAAIEEYRDAGCTHVMLELWGANRHEQIRLFGEQVLPHFRR